MHLIYFKYSVVNTFTKSLFVKENRLDVCVNIVDVWLPFSVFEIVWTNADACL